MTKGFIERIGEPSASPIGESSSSIKNHRQGIKVLIEGILKKGIVSSLDEISAIGHRVVHGAESFRQPQRIDERVIQKIKECSQLAPLHNPANLAGIIGCRKFFPNTPQVAVFDTAFHQSIPYQAYLYAIPFRYYKKYKVRKYGFHGTSHQYIAQAAAQRLKKPLSKVKLITCHLGNGCSITAVKNGASADTSMGFTPLEGLVMGTRCGDIDIAAVFHIMKKEKLSIPETDEILNKKSGLLGVSGLSNDFRVINQAIKKGNQAAKIAYQIFLHRIKKYIGAYYFLLEGADAICISGGIGENSSRLLADLKKSVAKTFSKKVKVLVIPTNEELMIANLTFKVIRSNRRKK